ncbi:MAG: glycogen/starch synthase [Bacteroidia bacterium]|nr:glycogen/starch synthase [Bacteroidia bacterium]
MKKEKVKVLFISQEITPFVESTEISKICRHLPQGTQESGKEIRVFMPRYGLVNERRNQLHEVIRLSGMNLIINDLDHPLIIKVASIQQARMQVYFIDNEEYFQRKAMVTDAKGKYFKDNDDRTVFFCRGVLETVKKLGWVPDIIHCHGWITSLIPMFVKTAYKEDPCFKNARVVYSVYNDAFEGNWPANYNKKISMEGISANDIKELKDANYTNLSLNAIRHSDALIRGSETISKEIETAMKKSGKNTLPLTDGDDYIKVFNNFYEEVMAGELV